MATILSLPTPSDVHEYVSTALGIPLTGRKSVSSISRDRTVLVARALISQIAHHELGHPLHKCSNAAGYRTHTGVAHACRRLVEGVYDGGYYPPFRNQKLSTISKRWAKEIIAQHQSE